MKIAPSALEAAKDGQAQRLNIDDFSLSYSTNGTYVHQPKLRPRHTWEDPPFFLCLYHIHLLDLSLFVTHTDPVVDQVARALTMLYVTDLRELQNDINDILVSAQQFTANP